MNQQDQQNPVNLGGQQNPGRSTLNPILSFLLMVRQWLVGFGLPEAVPVDYEPAVAVPYQTGNNISYLGDSATTTVTH